MATYSLADQAKVAQIISQVGAAPWVPFDSAAAEQLAGVAVTLGFVTATGDFMDKIRLAPTATLLEFLTFALTNTFTVET